MQTLLLKRWHAVISARCFDVCTLSLQACVNVNGAVNAVKQNTELQIDGQHQLFESNRVLNSDAWIYTLKTLQYFSQH